MYAISGITGQIGGAVGRHLLDAGLPVRAIVRDEGKAKAWADRGCEIAVATLEDVTSLTKAFRGAEGVFVLVPPCFDPEPGFPEARALAATLATALQAAAPARVVYLSTIGAQSPESNLLSQHGLIEEALRALAVPTTFLRPAWFMENCRWDVAAARESGVIPSFLLPLDKPFPMVATADIGQLAAVLLQESWVGHRVAELEGPHRITPKDIAKTFAQLLNRDVRMEPVPHETWQTLFTSQGMKNPLPRIRMLDGFNEGWIEFEAGEAGSRKGNTQLETVLQSLLQEEKS